VDEARQIILACDVTDETNDKKQAEPMAQAPLETLEHAAIERPVDDTDTQMGPRLVSAKTKRMNSPVGFHSRSAAKYDTSSRAP
jgi:hypothetical protein